MIIKQKKENGITIYTVDIKLTESKMKSMLNKFLRKSDIKHILDHSCDVYTKEGELLLKFRKKVISQNNIDIFSENIQQFAHRWSSNRGDTTGVNNKNRNIVDNPRLMTNIFGFFDRWSPRQKFIFNKLKTKPAVDVRECLFNMDHPEKYKKTIPLINEINTLYKKLIPDRFKKQNNKAKETEFKIGNTAFTTVTTNINFTTTVHRDSGDDSEGFGNLVVFEKKGKYSGGETCFPRYGIGVNVREGDILLMDVHEPHGNLPLKLLSKDAERMSIVCYLRKGVWLKTKGKSVFFFKKHTNDMHKIRRFSKDKNTNKTRQKKYKKSKTQKKARHKKKQDTKKARHKKSKTQKNIKKQNTKKHKK